jgi:hypothetical protein
VLLLSACDRQQFGPGLYGDAGMTASTPDQSGYVCGILRLIHDNIENEHITFDFGDVLMDAGLSGKKKIDGSWSYVNASKDKIALNYTYEGQFYSETYDVLEPNSDRAYYILKLDHESINKFEIYLEFFESQ